MKIKRRGKDAWGVCCLLREQGDKSKEEGSKRKRAKRKRARGREHGGGRVEREIVHRC